MNPHRLPGLLITLALIAIASPSPTAAEEATKATDDRIVKPYVEYRGGVSFVLNQNLKGADRTGSNLWGRAEIQEGFNVGAAAGGRFLEMFRAEFAIDYRLSDVENVGVVPGDTAADGDLSLLTFMVNGYVDYDLGLGIIPFAGAGIGYGHYRIDTDSSQIKVSDEDSLFVWNVMVGGTYPVNEVTDLSLGYRYLATEDGTVESKLNPIPPGTDGRKRLDSEYDAHEVYFGIRFKF